MIVFGKTPWVKGTRAERYLGPITACRADVAPEDVEWVLDEMLDYMSECAEDLGATHIVSFEIAIEIEEKTYTLSAVGTGAELTVV